MDTNRLIELLIGVIVLVFGGLLTMLMRHSAKLQAHHDLIYQLQGRFDGVEARTELAIRKVLEAHEEREMKKLDAVHSKLNVLLIKVSSLRGDVPSERLINDEING